MSRCLELWLFLFNKYFWIGILIPEPTSTWFQYAGGLDLPSYHVMLYAFLGKPPCQIHFKNAWHVALANSRCHVTFCVWVIGHNSQYVSYSFPSQFCWMTGKRVLYVLDPIFFSLKLSQKLLSQQTRAKCHWEPVSTDKRVKVDQS